MTDFEKYIVAHQSKLHKQKKDYFKLIISIMLLVIVVSNYDRLISLVEFLPKLYQYYTKGYII